MTRVLIIDDSPEDREFFADLLRRDKPQTAIDCCATSAEAFAMIRAVDYHAVLLDLRLDNEDGLEVLEQIKAHHPSLPVILVSGVGNEEIATEAVTSGAAYYLSKYNLNADALWTAITRVIDQSTADKVLQAQKDAMERSNRLEAAGQLAAGIAHDFNNQLGALRYSIELIQSTVPSDAADHYIGLAHKAIDECVALAGRMLSLSKQGNLVTQDVSAKDVLNDVRSLTSGYATDNLTLEIAAPSLDCFVHCDPSQLLNALVNLIRNAQQSIVQQPRSGHIQLVVRYTADTVSFVVTDTGDGMTPEVMAKCTDPFFTTKSDKKGSGLGLAMVQRFVNEADGQLIIQSTQGVGTEITIELPRVEPMSQPPQNDDPQSVPMARTGTNVLVVDDNTVLADMTKTVLELEGFAVQVFDNGVSAARYFDDGHRADLVISDIRMPKMNGFEMAEAIRRTSPETQFVFVTGYSDNIARSPNDLGSIVLQKPVSKDELLAAIEVALEPEAEAV